MVLSGNVMGVCIFWIMVMTNRPRFKLHTAESMIAIAALDIAQRQEVPAFNKVMAQKIIDKIVPRVKSEKWTRIGAYELGIVLQAVRVSIAAVRDPEMTKQAKDFINNMEVFLYHS